MYCSSVLNRLHSYTCGVLSRVYMECNELGLHTVGYISTVKGVKRIVAEDYLCSSNDDVLEMAFVDMGNGVFEHLWYVCDELADFYSDIHCCIECGGVYVDAKGGYQEINNGNVVDNVYYVEGRGMLCEDCRESCEDIYDYCCECDKLCLVYDLTETHDGDYVCDECLSEYYTRCDCCDGYFRNDCVTEVNYDTYVCERCLENHYIQCESCGDYVLYDYACFSDEDDCYYCESCFDERENERGCVNYYHAFKNSKDYTFNELKNEKSPYYLGVEIETGYDGDNRYANAKYVKDNSDLFELEQDASISSFEMISNPCTLNYWYSIENDIRELFDGLIKRWQRGHDAEGAGLHVHISKSAFKDNNAIERFVILVHQFQHNNELIARRSSSDYYKYCSCSHPITEFDFDRIGKYGHSVAVNLDNLNGIGTVEIRIFRSTLNADTFYATLEFVKSLVDASNSDMSIVRYSDLIKGKFLPSYVERRINDNHADIRLNDIVDFSKYNSGKLLKKLRSKRVAEMIREYSANHGNNTSLLTLIDLVYRTSQNDVLHAVLEGGNA